DGSGWRGRGMTAAGPAAGDGARGGRSDKRRQPFISARERNLLRPSGLWLFGSSLENLGIGTLSTVQFVFRPPGIDVFLMFFNTASRARRARGTQTPDLIVAREDSQMARASRAPAAFAARACHRVRTPPTSPPRSPARYTHHSARSSDPRVAASPPPPPRAWARRS